MIYVEREKESARARESRGMCVTQYSKVMYTAVFQLSIPSYNAHHTTHNTTHHTPHTTTSGAAPFVVTTTGHKADPVVRVWTPKGELLHSIKVIDSVSACVSQVCD